jgi:hypothetical protein
MRPRLPRFTTLATLPIWLVLASATQGQDADNLVPPPPAAPLPPPDLTPPMLAPAATSSAPAVIKLPTFKVIAPRDQPSALKETFEKVNHAFDGPFPSLRSGQLIEAILWRHQYLNDHPHETAFIATTQRGGKIRSATTIYTQEGKVYGSSYAVGENLLIAGLTAADLQSPDGVARAKKYLADYRRALGGAVAGSSGTGKPSAGGTAAGAALGSLVVAAEESGNYEILAEAAGPPEQAPTMKNGASIPGAQDARNHANQALRVALVQAFGEPANEILSWTYEALHNPARAGMVPVALTRVRVEGSSVTISPFAEYNNILRDLRADRLPSKNVISEKKHVSQELTALVFDWEGAQYLYQPDVGTKIKPVPLNAITGLPYLCIKGGALLECAYFCATYAAQHPEDKAVVLPGDPVLAAYQTEGKLGLFIPTLGRFTLPEDYVNAIDDPGSLGQLRDQLIALQKQQNAAPNVIPDEMAGDDADMQMRRAFLAFAAAGIPCQLKEEGAPSLDFTWDGVAYVYDADQQVSPAPGG